MSVDWLNTMAVSTSSGAQVSLANAMATTDYVAGTYNASQNWTPGLVFNSPYPLSGWTVNTTLAYSTSIRWQVVFDINVFGFPVMSPTINSQTEVVYNSSTVSQQTLDGTPCQANETAITSYYNSQNSISRRNSTAAPQLLFLGKKYNNTVCLPRQLPSSDDIAALNASGQAFCSSYNSLYPKTYASWATTSTTVASPYTATTTTTLTMSPSTTPTYTTTVTSTFWMEVYTNYLTTVTVTAPPNSLSLLQRISSPTGGLTQKRNAPELPGKPLLAGFEMLSEDDAAGQYDAGAWGDGHMHQLAPRQTAAPVATPAVAQNWANDEISYGCSQILSGTTVTSMTVTQTFTSGSTAVATQTVYAVLNMMGVLSVVPASTVTTTTTIYPGTAVTTTTVSGTTTSTVWAGCPLQTQVAPCFKILMHGPSAYDGRFLSYSTYATGLGLNVTTTNNNTTWYLSCESHLATFTKFAYVMGWKPNFYANLLSENWIGHSNMGPDTAHFKYPNNSAVVTAATFQAPTCVRVPGPQSGRGLLDCTSLRFPSSYLYGYPDNQTFTAPLRIQRGTFSAPLVANQTSPGLYPGFQQLSMEYVDVPCPCAVIP